MTLDRDLQQVNYDGETQADIMTRFKANSRVAARAIIDLKVPINDFLLRLEYMDQANKDYSHSSGGETAIDVADPRRLTRGFVAKSAQEILNQTK